MEMNGRCEFCSIGGAIDESRGRPQLSAKAGCSRAMGQSHVKSCQQLSPDKQFFGDRIVRFPASGRFTRFR
jgi:hypothetical protein